MTVFLWVAMGVMASSIKGSANLAVFASLKREH